MTDLTAWLTEESGVPAIDGVATAVKMVEALVGAGLSTSKVGAYARPLPENAMEASPRPETCGMRHRQKSWARVWNRITLET